MPSGAKKRKAAKKKKEKEAHTTNNNNNSSSINNNNNNNNNNPHEMVLENDDPRSQDERDSDGGSPASMDHHNQTHPFHEGNGESGKKDPSPVQSVVAENKSLEEVTVDAEGAQKVGLEDDGIVKTEREFKSEEGSESKNVSIEHVEFAKESDDGDNGSSSSSSSDDESRVFVKKLEEKAYNSDLEETLHHNEAKLKDSLSEEVKQVTENSPYVETDDNLVVEPASVVDEVKSVLPVSEEVVEVAESASVENSVVSDVIGSELKENVEKLLPISDGGLGISLVATDVVSKENNENKVFLLSDEIVGASSNVTGSAINGNVEKLLPTSDGGLGISLAATDVVSKENNESKVFLLSDEIVGASSNVTGSAINGNVEKLLPTSDGGLGISLAATDVVSKENNESKVFLLSEEIVGASSNVTGSAINGNESKILTSLGAPIASTDVVPKENNDVKVFPVSDENVEASSNVVGSATNGNQGIILTSSGAPIAGTSNGAENIKDLVIPEYSENEPLVASAPPKVQRTSWLSCCGLFDVLTGSC